MSDKRDGPRAKIELSCFGCRYERSEDYACQGDSGCRVYCDHPDVLAESVLRSSRRVGDTTWVTPAWCPLRSAAIERLLAVTAPTT